MLKLYKMRKRLPSGYMVTAYCVAIPLSRGQIRKQYLNAEKPGIHLFRGAWYGRDLADITTYGKICGRLEDFHGHAMVRQVGRVGRRVAAFLRKKI